jgi:hypothetical protein
MLSDMRGQIETPGMDSRCNLIKRTGEDLYLGERSSGAQQNSKMLYNENSFGECYAIDGPVLPGVDAFEMEIEVYARWGPPEGRINVVGLPDTAVKESTDRSGVHR